MRKVLFYIFALLLCLSCGKHTPDPDPADYFVGNYTFTDNYYLRWGGDSRALANEGYFTLSKVSANQVEMTGAWNTLGTVTGNIISFSSCPQSDASGYLNFTFGVASLYGEQLSFTYSAMGSVQYKGVPFPMEVSGNVVARKTTN